MDASPNEFGKASYQYVKGNKSMEWFKLNKKRFAGRKVLLAGGLVALAMTAPVSNDSILSQWSNVIEAQAATTFSKYWFQDELGNWKVKDAKGNIVTNAWLCDDAVPENGKEVWYLLDGNGNMISAGLVQDGTGNYYSLETNHNGYFGMLRYVSGNYDDIQLNLENQHNGSFAKILNEDGLAALMAKYGVTTFAINNDNCVYTSQFAAEEAAQTSTTAKKSSGGGGGGGGGSSSSSGSSSSTSTTAKKQKAVEAAVEDFMDEYITNGMTDFEKEMMIIQYMVENIDYDWENYEDGTIPTDSYSAYGALVEGVAVCDGYADAFMELAEACDLTVKKVTGTANGTCGWEGHAWNQIKLGGEWYNVDVTWEDPILNGSTSNGYKFGNLRNEYINLTDKQLKTNHKWSSGAHVCDSEIYNDLMVVYYLMTGKVDPEIHGDKWRRFLMFENEAAVTKSKYQLLKYGFKLEDGSNYFIGDDAEEDVLSFIDKQIADRHGKGFYITTDDNQAFTWLDANWLRNNVGGLYAERSEGWSTYVNRDMGDYWGYIFKYTLDESPLLTQAQSKALLEKSLKADKSNLIATEDEMEAYIESLIEQRASECTIVFDSQLKVVSDYDWVTTNSVMKRPTCVENYYIAVDGHPYTVCSYELSYKNLNEMLDTYLNEDNSNLYTEADNGLLEHFKTMIDLPKEGTVLIDYVVLKNADYKDRIAHLTELRSYAKENNADVRWEDLKIDSKKSVSFDGDEYTVYQLYIPYYNTLDELLDRIPKSQLETDRSNFVTPTEIDKAAEHLSKKADAGKTTAYVVVYYESQYEYEEKAVLGNAIADKANSKTGNASYQWSYVKSPSYNSENMKEGDVCIFYFSWTEKTSTSAIALMSLDDFDSMTPSNAAMKTE